MAIAEIRDAHGDTCDLTHPGTPASTASLARYDGDRVEYLVLGDSPLVHDCRGQVEVITDLRVQRVGKALRAAMPAEAENAVVGSPEYAEGARRRVAAQREYINRPDGYWIASNEPEAARHALTGALPLTGPEAVRPGLPADRRRLPGGRHLQPVRLAGAAGRGRRPGTGAPDRHGPGRRVRAGSDQAQAARRRDRRADPVQPIPE